MQAKLLPDAEATAIQQFVHYAMSTPPPAQLLADPLGAIAAASPTDRVARILLQMLPFLTGERSFAEVQSSSWWIK